jgi:hypothetical protein
MLPAAKPQDDGQKSAWPGSLDAFRKLPKFGERNMA